MRYTSRQALIAGALAAVQLFGSISIYGTTFTWQNGTSDITNSANWIPTGVPTGSDTANFTNTGNLTPSLTSSSLSHEFSVGNIGFSINSQSYTFLIDGPVGFNVNQLGVFNFAGAAAVQTFNIGGFGVLQFNNSSSADGQLSGAITYNAGSLSGTPTPGLLQFVGLTDAGAAKINGIAGATIRFLDSSTAKLANFALGEEVQQTNAELEFGGNADAGNSTISAIESSLIGFSQNSSAKNALIELGGGTNKTSATLIFSDTSGAGSANISAIDGSTINFNRSASADSANISLQTGVALSQLNFSDQSNAGASNISVESSNLNFLNQSNASSAFIRIGSDFPISNGTATFSDSSSAGNAFITAIQGSTITFKNSSTSSFASIHLGETGSFANSATLAYTNNASAGNAKLVANTSSTITFSNASTASNAAITLNDTTLLTFNDSSSAGTSAISITKNAILNLAQTTDENFNALLTANGTVNKTGTDKLNFLSDNSAFAGITNVQAGNLALNNNLGGNVNVSPSGIISGTGNVIGVLTVGGTVAPGNSIGTLTVTGSFVQQSGSTYQVQVDNAGDASLINVVGTPGTATIDSNTTVNVTALAGQLPANQHFTVPILHADGGRTGTYTTLTSSNPLISAVLTYDPKDVFLTFQNTFSLIGRNENQRAVATQLQSITNPTAQETAVLNAIASLDPSQASHTLQQLSAEQYAYALFSAEESTERFLRRLYDPLRDIIATDPCCQFAPCNCSCPIETWASGGYIHSSVKKTKEARGLHSNGYEISVGAQDRLNRFWTLGLAGAYQKDDIDYRVGGSGQNRTGLGAFYALYRPSCFYILGDLVVGFSSQRLKRHIAIDDQFFFEKHGKPQVFQSALYIEAGKDFWFDWFDCMLVQPFIGLETGFYRRNHIREHSENSLFDVSIAEKSIGTASSRLGLHFNTHLWCSFLFNADIAWRYQINPIDRHIDERFTTFGTDFGIESVNWGHNSIDGAFNLAYLIGNCIEIYAEADGQWWDKASAYALVGGLKIRW